LSITNGLFDIEGIESSDLHLIGRGHRDYHFPMPAQGLIPETQVPSPSFLVKEDAQKLSTSHGPAAVESFLVKEDVKEDGAELLEPILGLSYSGDAVTWP
jgi:hypothetical protein